MSDVKTGAQSSTASTDSPVDVHELQAQAVEEAKKKAEKLVQDLADVVMQQQGPPGTPSLRKTPGG